MPGTNTFKHRFSRVVIYTLLFIFALFFLIPVYLVVATAFKDRQFINLQTVWELPVPQIFATTERPATFSTEGFNATGEQLGPRFANSVILVIFATTISSLIGSMNGYILAKWRIPFAGILFPLMLFGMFIPYQAVLFPLQEFLKSFEVIFDELRRILGYSAEEIAKDNGGLYGGLPGLILIHVVYGLPITTLIFRNFYADIPNELLEAGAIDGAGFFGIYTRVVFPLSIPGLWW